MMNDAEVQLMVLKLINDPAGFNFVELTELRIELRERLIR